MKKRGQVTIFIIIAVMIIIFGILIFVFYPNIKTQFVVTSENPNVFMQNCLEDSLKENTEKISLQGGSLEPENYILYDNEKVEYLCYTEEDYKTCVSQQPLLKSHIEEELEKGIKDEADSCLDNLKESFEKRGYSVNLKKNEMRVELLPKKIAMIFNSSLVLGGDETKKYDSINIVLDNNLYEFVGIASSIINWESTYGDSETTIYMNYYHDLKVEKPYKGDKGTVYVLTDRNTENKFQFASRSRIFPPGF